MHVEFHEEGCKNFFKKYSKQKDIIVRLVGAATDKEVAGGTTKVKLTIRRKVNDKNTYEFWLNTGTIGSIQIAFSTFDKKTTVYSISKNFQKSAFSKDFDKIIAKL